VDPEVAGVLIADHEMPEFVGSGSTATPWFSPEAHHGDRYIAVDHR
jgi:hypothetical protein